MLLTLAALPIAAGLAIWTVGDRRAGVRHVTALGSLAAGLGLAMVAAAQQPTSTVRWGAGLELRLEVADISRAPLVMVAFVGAAVVSYALAYGEERGRSRLVGLLVAFVGTMELLLVAGDLLTLLIAWELVGLVSWGLIAHRWQADAPGQATHAFLATRAGDLGLFVAAGAAFAGTGTLHFADLPAVTGGLATALAVGVLVAAAAKSAQLPFSPWLFSAMAGPTPASALLHSATMVAAGAYLLARLHPFLDTVAWFGPVTIAVGLATALAGGVVAFLQPEAKKLLAASTSAQYGLMFVAVGAGHPAVAMAHLVAHGLFKALLFVSAGVAIDAAGTDRLAGMRLGRRLPGVAVLTLVGALALAAVPPLGAAWTKEKVVAAAVHHAPWIGVLVIVAGGLSALYAARFQLLAFGRRPGADENRADAVGAGPARAALVALAALAVASAGLGVLWLPWGQDRLRSLSGQAAPSGAVWELVASLAVVAAAGWAAVVLDRRTRLARSVTVPTSETVVAWLGLPALARMVVADPTLACARAAARLDDRVVDRGIDGTARVTRWISARASAGDDRVVDAGVRGVARLATWFAGVLDRVGEVGVDGAVHGVARLTGAAGRDGRRLQSGQTHLYYAGITAGFALLVLATLVWS